MTAPYNPDNYDPFKHYEPYQEVHQRINQTLSQAGCPAVLDWPEIDAMAEAMAATTFFDRISYLDADPEGQALAMETISFYRLYVEFKTLIGETWIGYHAGTQHDWSIPSTMNRTYALMAFDPKILFPLSRTWTWQDAATKYLTRYQVCDVDVSYGCEQDNATEVLAIKCGEFVCIYKTCTACRAWFDEPDRAHFRRRDFFCDIWDRQ